MPQLTLKPTTINRQKAPEALTGAEARRLTNVDVSTERGTILRAAGYSRASFETGISVRVLAAEPFLRRDGTRLLVWATAGGTWTAQVAPAAAHAAGDF